MNTLQYRCYFFDPSILRPDRPVQAFFTHREQANDWAKCLLNRTSCEEAEVWIYKVEEILEGSFKKKSAAMATDKCT